MVQRSVLVSSSIAVVSMRTPLGSTTQARSMTRSAALHTIWAVGSWTSTVITARPTKSR